MMVNTSNISLRAAVFIALALICGVFNIAGVATAIAKTDSANFELSLTLWKSCSKATFGGSSRETCADVDDVATDCFLHSYRAMRAFGILAILWAFLVCIPLGVADFLHKLPEATAKLLLLVSAAVLAVFELIFWAIWAGLWNSGCGDYSAWKETPDAKWGPAAPLFIVSWLLSMAMMAVALFGPATQVKEVPPTTTATPAPVVVTNTRPIAANEPAAA